MRKVGGDCEELLAPLRADQLERWQHGQAVLVEDYLRQQPSLSDNTDAVLDLIYSEILLREEFGDRPDPQEYLRRFPQFADTLRRQFAVHEALTSTAADGDVTGTTQTLPATVTPTGTESLSRPLAPAAPEFREIGGYEILGELGRGGMGVVYLGRHRLLDSRMAAIKVIRQGGSAVELDRFHFEARTVAQLQHENIVPIYELGIHKTATEEMPFVALEYVAGGNLAQKINGTPLPPRQAAELFLPLAEAMRHAHERGILHRDLKPANILLAFSDASQKRSAEQRLCEASLIDCVPKITDFGLARNLGDTGRTQSGAILGTPSYMPPEQATGQGGLTAAADVYSLGAVLYEMLTGRPPFKADTVLNTLQQVVALDPVPPHALSQHLPRDLETICLKCLQKDPKKRYQTAGELAADVRRFLAGEPILARPVSWAERAVKWMRRRPALAALLGASVLALVGLVVAGVVFTARLQAERDRVDLARAAAVEERDKADTERRRAEREKKEAQLQAARADRILKLAVADLDLFATNLRSAKVEELSTGNTGGVLYRLACSYARASAALKAETGLLAKDREKLVEQYARGAVKLLHCADKVGYFGPQKSANRADLKNNEDLAPLRRRPEFQALLVRLNLR